ncbi:MAG: FtsX-like permease family protein [Candidatus Latescibacterota bacterium]|nr:FtsX-like permease family protein [Candidatus Latescibacterota bacterium]
MKFYIKCFLLLIALAIPSLLLFGNPVQINQTVNDYFGWKASLPKAGKLISDSEAKELRKIASQIDSASIAEKIYKLSTMGSRVTGYEGAEKAADFIFENFEKIGLKEVKRESFNVTVPMDKGGTLKVSATSETFPIYGLWPNGVRTPTLPDKGIKGSIIYGGKGSLKDLDGHPIEDCVILLDFDGGQNYLNAASLGASAIIFFDNGGVTREQASDKFLKVSVDIPRFWIDGDIAQKLIKTVVENRGEVRLNARMDWEEVRAENIFGWLPGNADQMPLKTRESAQKWEDQVIVIQAYYDAISVVPAIGPGAENAVSIVTLLEIAKILQKTKPNYSILFLATAGHFEGMAGINDFVYRHSRGSSYFDEKMRKDQRIDFDLMFTLDLSSRSRQSIAFGTGTFYNPEWKTDSYVKYMLTPYSKRLSAVVEEVFSDSTRHIEGLAPSKRTWKNYMPIPLAFASEAVQFVGKKALTFSTPNDTRPFVDTPLDNPHLIDIQNVKSQIENISTMLVWGSRDSELLKPSKLQLEDYGHSLGGSIYWFDRDVNFAVPKSPVSGAVVTYQQIGGNSVGGVRTLILDQTDENGRFRFDIMRNRYSNIIKAYEIDGSGAIVSAPDMGQDGDETYPMEHDWGWWENEMLQVIFKCRALSLFETVDSRYLSVLDHLTVLDDRDGVPQSWGADFIERQSNEEGKVTLASVVYAPSSSRVKVLMSTSLFGVRYLLSGAPDRWLTSPISPEEVGEEELKTALGRGYEIDDGILLRPGYAAARDMWVLDDIRIKQLAKYGVKNEEFMRLHEDARTSLLEARDHLIEKDYTGYKAATREAWGLEGRGYPEIKSTADDTIYGVIFYFALLLPFSFCCERLFFGHSDVRKQLFTAALFFMGIFGIMHLIHPAFKLSSSPYIIFLAFVIFSIGSAALVMILGRFTREVAQRKRATAGVHEADIGRLSATSAAISLGISNLRKRKTRTLLTVITLTLLTFTTQAFTSVQSYLKYYQIPRGNSPGYEGVLLRDRGWKGLQQSVLDYATSAFGNYASVLPRSWFASQVIGERAYIDIEKLGDSKKSFAAALHGVSQGEGALMGLESLLVGTKSRWFLDEDRMVCILPTSIADILSVSLHEIGEVSVNIMGQAYLVIGIIDNEMVDRVRDLDDESPMPVDTVAEAKKMEEMAGLDPRLMDTAAIETFTHLLAQNVVLMPYRQVIDLGGTLRSISLANFKNPQHLTELVESFVSRVAVPLFVGTGTEVSVYTSMGSATLSGMSNLLVPLAIAALIVLNTMMGSVYERSSEIGVYSSVGLAPSHVGSLFLAEAFVFAIMGSVLGYLVGQTTTLILTKYDLLAGMFLNYSSLSAITSTSLVMATVILSTLWPARKASSMSVPDVTRRWSFPEPDGDHWKFDFPFTLASGDAAGIGAYLHRIFSSYGEGSVGEFMTEEVKLSSELIVESKIYKLELMAWLAPYDLGVSQRVELIMSPTEDIDGIYRIEINITRLSGDVASWKRLNVGFLNVLRKRFLVWRTITPEMRADYVAMGGEMDIQSSV